MAEVWSFALTHVPKHRYSGYRGGGRVQPSKICRCDIPDYFFLVQALEKAHIVEESCDAREN